MKKKWMSKIPNKKKLSLLNIPGTHDSTAYNISCLGSCFAKTQDMDILTQLNIGVRLFDIRVTKNNSFFSNFSNSNNFNFMNSLICCHGIFNCYHSENNKNFYLTYEYVLRIIKNFLEENPSEIVIIKTDSGRGNKFSNIENASEIFDTILGNIAVKFNNNYTLGELRGKVVYMFTNKIEGGTDIIPIHEKYSNGNENFKEFKVDGELKVKEIKDLLEKYNYDFTEAEKNMVLPLNFETSCTGEFNKIIPLPRYEANIVNKFLKEYYFKKGKYYGWISIDFIDEFIANKIIESNFYEDNNNINNETIDIINEDSS